jgi:hypothetical protein
VIDEKDFEKPLRGEKLKKVNTSYKALIADYSLDH